MRVDTPVERISTESFNMDLQRCSKVRANIRRGVHLAVVVARNQNRLGRCVHAFESTRDNIRSWQELDPGVLLHGDRRDSRGGRGCGRARRHK